ncbi:MAG: hypothetical protein JJE03_06100 [Peptostreptococcaceae bacterium]|nr:hypothetical protein [Peptostreptococcaceae bacterium]
MSIAASASKMSYCYFLTLGHDIKLLEAFYHFETLIVFALVVLVIIRYGENSISKLAKEENVKFG